MDVLENSATHTIIATLELPGLKRSDVRIEIVDGHIIVSGEFKEPTLYNEVGYTSRSRKFGRFSRSLPLAKPVAVSFHFLLPHRLTE